MQTEQQQPEQLPDSLVHNVEAVELNIYQLKTKVDAKFEVNRSGCGWEPDTEDDGNLDRFDRHEVLQSLRDSIQDGGQDLANYSDNPDITQIDVVVASDHSVEFYVHSTVALDIAGLRGLKENLAGQLSDGFGEVFEQRDFLEASPRYGHTDYKLGFTFDWKGLSEPKPYDSTTMRSLQEIEHLVDRETNSAPRPRF